MKPPRFLVGAALLFWGWQTEHLIAGAVMAVILEAAPLVKARWDFSDDDFSRAWTFCTLLFLASAVYAFTSNDGPTNFQGLFRDPNLHNQRNVGASTARTAASVIRWLPMTFFLFIAAQGFSSREGIPLETISLILRRRWKRARKLGQPLPAQRRLDIGYAYFALCLLAASSRQGEDTKFFWGLCALLGWALWQQRSRRFSWPVWAGALGAAMVLGYAGQGGLSRLRTYLETFNPQWLSRFTRRGGFDPDQSKTALGQIGRLKASTKIVIRLEPKGGSTAPTLLREASYRICRGQKWDANSSRSDWENVLAETNNTTFLLLPEKTNTAIVNLACYLRGGQDLLPLPRGAWRLDNLPAFGLQKNNAGAVLAQGPGLVLFDATYGPGATIDGEPSDTLKGEDYQVPTREMTALDQVIAELNLTGQSTDQILRSINGFFQNKFSYRIWQDRDRFPNANITPLARFLTQTRSGHCEYFATATVLLLRQLHIPARYAVGYVVHEGSGNHYVVRQRDAHAWCLVWDAKKQLWQDFDTTPASWLEVESRRTSPLQAISDLWSGFVFQVSKLRWGQNHLRQYILWGLVPVFVLLLYQILFRSKRTRRGGGSTRPPAARNWPGMDSEFFQLERRLLARGLPRPAGEPLSAWLLRAARDPALVAAKAPLKTLLALHYRYRFDPQGLDAADRQALNRAASQCLGAIEGRKA